MRSSASGRKDRAAARGAEGAAAAVARGEISGEIASPRGGPSASARRLMTSSQYARPAASGDRPRAACHASHLARAVTASRDGWATLVAGAAVCLNHAYRRSRSALETCSAGSSRAALVALSNRCCSPGLRLPRGRLGRPWRSGHCRAP